MTEVPKNFLESINSIGDEAMRNRALVNIKSILNEWWVAAEKILSWSWAPKNRTTTSHTPPPCRKIK